MRQNLVGVPIPNCSEYITLHVYQFWCFYEKVNNSPKISAYAAALLSKCQVMSCVKMIASR